MDNTMTPLHSKDIDALVDGNTDSKVQLYDLANCE